MLSVPNPAFLFVQNQILNQKTSEANQKTLGIIDAQQPLVQLIQDKTSQVDEILILAERPDLYFLSDRKPAYKYVTIYHFQDSDILNLDKIIDNNQKLKLVLLNDKVKISPIIKQKLQISNFVLSQNHHGLSFYEKNN